MSQDDQGQPKGSSTLTQVQPDEEVALVDNAPVLGDINSKNVKQNFELFKGIGGNYENVETEDFLTITSNFIDRNLQSIKWTIYGTLCVTALGLAHHLRLFTKFRQVDDIPLDFFIKKQKLRGVLRRRCPQTDVLYVEHVPPIRWRSKNKATSFTDGLLPVSLAGIKVTHTGRLYIDNLVDRRMWFTLLQEPLEIHLPTTQHSKPVSVAEQYRQRLANLSSNTQKVSSNAKNTACEPSDNKERLECSREEVEENSSRAVVPVMDSTDHETTLRVLPVLVHCRLPRGVLRRNINHTLVSNGVAKVKDYSELEPGILHYKDTVNDLVKAEATAANKGLGDWPKLSRYERTKDYLYLRYDRWKSKRAASKADDDMGNDESLVNEAQSNETWPTRWRDKINSIFRRKL